MRKHSILAGAALALATISAAAFSDPAKLPQPEYRQIIVGGGALATGSVNSNAELGLLSTAYLKSVVRLGYAAAGDGPAVTYNASASACSLNSGAGDGGSQIRSADNKCWIAVLGPQIDARAWGAKCNGVADDTVALQRWINLAATDGAHLLIPNATCKFTAALVFPTTTRFITLSGAGRQSELLYAGANTSLDAVTIGDSNPANSAGCSAKGWTLRDFRLSSSTVMTGGYALKLHHLCETNIYNVAIGGNLDGNTNWYNATHFAGGNSIHSYGLVSIARNKGIVANGDSTYQLTDINIIGGKIVGAAWAINLAGKVGGFYLDSMNLLGNGGHLLIDQSEIAEPNLQVFLGPTAIFDFTAGGAGTGIRITDPGGASSEMVVTGSWISSARPPAGGSPGQARCIDIASSAANWRIAITGARMTNCNGDAIRSESATAHIAVVGGIIGGAVDNIGANNGFGINQTVANPNVSAVGVSWGSNISGRVSGHVLQPVAGKTSCVGPNCNLTSFGTPWTALTAVNQDAVTYRGMANSTVGDSAALADRWVGGTANSWAEWRLSDKNGSPTYGLSVGSGVTRVSLPAITTGPLTYGAYTVAGAPTCNTALKYTVIAIGDATSPTWGSALTGGGSTATLAFCNGSAWVAR